MTAVAAGPLRARSDEHDRLVEADEPIAALQRRSGGEFPGVIAIPALLALVRKARAGHVQLARRIHARDEGAPLTAWADVAPEGSGTAIALTGLQRGEPVPEQARAGQGADAWPLLRQVADAAILLDAGQCVLHAEIRDEALRPLEPALATRPRWTDLTAGAEAHPGTVGGRPLHWRLLDGTRVGFPGIEGSWRARLIPAATGFELLLVAEALPALPCAASALATSPAGAGSRPHGHRETGYHSLLAREFAPSLRQPINRIVANAETIRGRFAGPLPDTYADYAGNIADAARHLLGLVDDLGELETVESPGFATEREAIDLADCARRAAGILAMRAAARSIRLVVPGIDTRAPATAEFRRVLQILLNLTGNAIAYCPQGTTVTLETGRDVARDEGRAWVAVADEGPGFTSEQAGKVFQKFERLGRDQDGSASDGGSGLGLYIARRLALAMDGDLAVSATPGRGARFTLTLPAR